MKTIKLQVYYSDFKGMYYIPLENRERINFKTKRLANEFLSKYKKYLKDNVNSLLYNYSRIHSVFLDYYLQLDSKNSNQLKNINKEILDKIDLIFNDFGEGWSSLIFENLESAYFLIHQFIDYLKKYAQKFKIQNLIHRVNSILQSYWNDFNNHRQVQKDINKMMNYRKSKLLTIVHNTKRQAIST